MRTLVKLKPGEAAILFKKEGVMLVQGDETLKEGDRVPPNVSNAAVIVYAMQQPLFIEIVMNFLKDMEGMTKKMETETVH